MTLEEIDISVLQIYLGKLAKDNFSVWLVARCKTLVSSILEYACELEFIRRNPARSRSYRMPVCKAARKPVLSMAQILSLWNAITNQRDHLIVRVGTCCAVTANELLGLVWECVTPDHLIIRSMAYRGELTEWRVKRKARFRAVPITPTIHREFEQWRAMSENTEDAAMVFPNAKGTGPIWNGTFLQKRVAPIARKLKIAVPVNFQVLRRSFATWNKASLKDAQSVLGHGDIATTANVYAQEVEVDAAALVANYEKRIMNSGKGKRVQ
jgi:integrase